MSALDDQARAKILQISTAEEPDSVSPALVSTAMDLLRQIGSANEQAISQTGAAASALGDRTSILEMELTRQVGSLLKDATTSGADQWIFVSQSVRKGEVLAIEWSCPTTGNHFSFQSGDSSLAYVETLYDVESSTETSGLWYINAPKNIASLRIFSANTSFRAKVYKLGDTNMIELLNAAVSDLEQEMQEESAETGDAIGEIRDQLFQAELVFDEMTNGTEQWIFVPGPFQAGDILRVNWSCPTTGNHFSINKADDTFHFISNLYDDPSTTSKRGSWQMTVSQDMATITIFSHDTGFRARVSKGELQSVLEGFGTAVPQLDVKETGLYNISTGAIDSTTAWYGDNCKVSVKPGQVVSFKVSPLAEGYGVAWMSGNTCIGGIWFDVSAAETRTVTVPEGASEMRISWNRNWVPSQSVKIDNTIDKVRERLSNVETAISSLDLQRPHAGGSILSLGDSYTMMNHYGRWLAEATGCTQTPRGYNGQNIRHFADDTYQSTADWAVDINQPLTAAILKQYSIITIMGGTNDYGQGCAAGTISDSKEANTVAGHLKWLLDKLYTLHPDARIYVCTQPYRVPHPAFHDGAGAHIRNAGGSTLEECMDAVVAVCRYYGVPCLDFYHESGWNEWTNRVTNPENGEPSASNIYPPFNDNPLTLDGLHPRNGEGKGAQQLGYMFGQFINTH